MGDQPDYAKSRTGVWLTFFGSKSGLLILGVVLGLAGIGLGLLTKKEIVELIHGPPKTPDPAPAATPSATPAPRPQVPATAVLADIKADLERAPAGRRATTRYLSLAHLSNDSRVPDGALDEAREAVRLAVERLSPPGAVAALRPVDGAKLVFAVDWGELGTDTTVAWGAVLRAYPYGLDDEGAAARAVRGLSGTPLAVVRGDWFARAALRPDLAGPGAPLHRPGAVPPALAAFARKYDEQRVDAAAAASELGLTDASRVAAAVLAELHLRDPHGLGPLAAGGSVPRSVWESTEFVTSPFQELARALAVGTPLRAD